MYNLPPTGTVARHLTTLAALISVLWAAGALNCPASHKTPMAPTPRPWHARPMAGQRAYLERSIFTVCRLYDAVSSEALVVVMDGMSSPDCRADAPYL